MIFLYSLSSWALGLLIVSGCVFLALCGYRIFWLFRKQEFTEAQRGAALSILGVVATINSLVLAFTAISVWEAFDNADEAVAQEASTAMELARDLFVFGSPAAMAARTELRQYIEEVVNVEWPAMGRGQSSELAWDQIHFLFQSLNQLQATSANQTALLAEIWQRVNELVKHRRARIFSSLAEVPDMLWSVVLLDTAIMFCLAYVLTPDRFNTAMIGILAASMGLVFFFIVAMDHPFLGEESISPSPFALTLKNMQREDRLKNSSTHSAPPFVPNMDEPLSGFP